MQKTYKEIKGKDVLSELGKSMSVLIVDLNKKKIIDCNDLTVSQINIYIEDPNCIFYES